MDEYEKAKKEAERSYLRARKYAEKVKKELYFSENYDTIEVDEDFIDLFKEYLKEEEENAESWRSKKIRR